MRLDNHCSDLSINRKDYQQKQVLKPSENIEPISKLNGMTTSGCVNETICFVFSQPPASKIPSLFVFVQSAASVFINEAKLWSPLP
jgi:hypothetical protein